MRKSGRSRRKRPGESDKILRFAVAAVLLLFLVAGIVVAVRLMNPRVDATEGRKRLEEVASADVQESGRRSGNLRTVPTMRYLRGPSFLGILLARVSMNLGS